MQIHYFGWSGITIQYADMSIGFDLYGDALSLSIFDGASTAVLCATHGHPEHCGSFRRLLGSPEAVSLRSRMHLISSPEVVGYINQNELLPDHNARAISDREHVQINGVQITGFGWKHLPLLPPGIGPKVEYAVSLLSHPIDFVRIGLMGLSLPMNAPTLGFHFSFPDGTTMLNYAEGLHRLTNPQEVEAIARELPAEILLFAVEPEDADAIPRWVEILNPSKVCLYEAHRPWRELFRLPYIDLNEYADQLAKRFPRITFDALVVPGMVVA